VPASVTVGGRGPSATSVTLPVLGVFFQLDNYYNYDTDCRDVPAMNPSRAVGNHPRGQASAGRGDAIRRRDGIRRRDELLDAALTCFSERGLLNTRIEDIRQAAGASPSSVYNLFDGLPSLAVALLIRTFGRLFAHITSRAQAETRPDAVIRAVVDGHLEWVLGHESEARFMYSAMALELASAQREELAELKAELAVPVMKHLASLAGEGALPVWPDSSLEFIVLGSTHEACRRYLAGAPVDLAGLRGLLPEVAWRSVSAFAGAALATRPGQSN
jgi:AcrR family transcriptional regulator